MVTIKLKMKMGKSYGLGQASDYGSNSHVLSEW